MISAATIDGFVTLFRGRGDAYGSWTGGCVKQTLGRRDFSNHLHDGPYIGIYPALNINGVAHCVWGCTDIDYDDYDEARRLADTFAAVNVTAWTEKTRKGWHVWVFATELVPAENMRRMFLAAHQVADSKPKEVNPKQTTLRPGEVGNYVRLPYPGGLDERRVYDTNVDRMALDMFVATALDHRVTPDVVANLADYYIPPATVKVEVTAPSQDMATAARTLTPLGRTIFRNGPIEGRDRSTTLAHLAHECFKSSLPPADALMILEDADLRWGKYLMRGEAGMTELLKLVQRAYGESAATPST